MILVPYSCLQMPINVAERVSALIEEAGRIERESETVYLELGSLFPRLSAEMGRSADIGERSLRALSSLGQSSLGSGRAGGASCVDEAAKFFRCLRERDSAFLARINEGITRLGALDEIIARVRADSEEMEIISLNAMTVALKSGAEGKAFSVITDELKRLSGRTIVLTEGVTESGHSLLDFFARLRNSLAELDDFQRGFFETIDETLGAGYDEIAEGLSGATALYSALLGEARSVREPVLRVMGEIQLQDIVRQSLQHVGISLEEALESAGSADEASAAFVAAVAELTGSLIEDIIGKLDASAASFGADMGAVNAIVGESERQRAAFLEGGRVRSASAEPADSAGFRRSSERYLELKRTVVAMSSRVAEQVEGLEGSFKGLAALLSRFQNIVVASRIEVAKTKALAGVSTTVGGMIELTDRIEADVGAAVETTKAFTALASAAIVGYSREGGGEGDALVTTLAAVEQDMARLSGSKDSVGAAIEDFSLYTDDFIALIGRAGEDLSRLRALIDRLRAVDASLGELRDSIREGLGADAAPVESDRMRRMVERFTIFTHKKAAGAIGRFAVEEGGEAGEVTLF
jgi:hypothetical protein